MSASKSLIVQRDSVIAKLNGARKLLAEATSLQAVKQVLDVGHAAEVLARRQNLGQETVRYATGIINEAGRVLGEMMKKAPKNKGTRGQLKGKTVSGGSKKDPPEESTPTLAEQGVDKKTADRARKLGGAFSELPPVVVKFKNRPKRNR
ncbi:MAG: hypothetical protein ACREX9_23180 [Gammaproteobacteria bacterium]